MVHEQGEVIDSIESNIENTAVHVTTGAEELRQVVLEQGETYRSVTNHQQI